MERSKWLAIRETPRHPETRRYVHVSTRYKLLVKSVKPLITGFEKTEKGVTFRRAAPKLVRPGQARRHRLADERMKAASFAERLAAGLRERGRRVSLSIFK